MDRDSRCRKISLTEWSDQFRDIGDDVIKKYIYYGAPTWGAYLQPPATFMVYGSRELKRLQFDNSLAALRLWGFVFNETERLFRGRQTGKKIIATAGDLGTVPVIIHAFKDCVPFYPECLWWTPFFRESTELLETASALGAPEAACFSKTVLAAFYKKAYFPKPDLIFASSGASCDDYSCILQQLEAMSNDLVWLEMPLRRDKKEYYRAEEYKNMSYPERFEKYLTTEYQKVWDRMTELAGPNGMEKLAQSIRKNNRLRGLTERIKQRCFSAAIAPLPALELMTIEFGSLYGYADIDEWIEILKAIEKTVEERIKKNTGVLPKDARPIAWVTPSADPVLLNIVEDLGCRVVATEYVINQALVKIDESIDPFLALARSFMKASLIGSTKERVAHIKEHIRDGAIAGVLITNMLGASHCAMEAKQIEKELNGVPVLSIDVPAPSGINEQIKTRIAAFVEMMR